MIYAFVYITPLVVFLSLYIGGVFSYFAITFVFVIVPSLELLMRPSVKNLNKHQEERRLKNPLYDVLLYGLVPCQIGLMLFFLNIIGGEQPIYEKIGLMTAFGMACGVLGINAAHELGHRRTFYEQFMSKLLLLTTLYMHFFIEHNRGHHKNVSTEEDPASASFGETVYAFYLRSIIGGWLSAWKLESERLKIQKKLFLSIHNEMLIFQIIQVTLLFFIAFYWGTETMLYFLGSAIIGFLLLETVNYIEHYGLRRKKKEGVYERTLPIHSWNSDHPLGRVLLLELSRHSDHHYIASRKYQVLRHFDQSPQMPTGYAGMMLLALVPPLWFKIMHNEINKYKESTQGDALA